MYSEQSSSELIGVSFMEINNQLMGVVVNSKITLACFKHFVICLSLLDFTKNDVRKKLIFGKIKCAYCLSYLRFVSC